MEGKMNIRKAAAEDLDTIWIRKGATGRSPLFCFEDIIISPQHDEGVALIFGALFTCFVNGLQHHDLDVCSGSRPGSSFVVVCLSRDQTAAVRTVSRRVRNIGVVSQEVVSVFPFEPDIARVVPKNILKIFVAGIYTCVENCNYRSFFFSGKLFPSAGSVD